MSRPESSGQLVKPRRVVIKIGTEVVTSGIGQLNRARLDDLARQVTQLRDSGCEVLVVSSGAVGIGMGALSLARRPTELPRKQACAAVGQGLLMQHWQQSFAPHGVTVAQVLLTHEDLRTRARFLGVQQTLRQLQEYKAVPIINENDTVSAAEIKFGDNDILSAMVASLVDADYLIMLSTAPGLIDRGGTRELVPVVEKITATIEAMAGGTTSETATGGMISKIAAAKVATRAGCGVFIAGGAEPDIIAALLDGTGRGTFFVPHGIPLEAKKRWLAHFQRPSGTLYIDGPAKEAVRSSGRSLLAVGVTSAGGTFGAGEVVNIAGPDLQVFARGRSAYSSTEIPGLARKKGSEMSSLYPERRRLEVVHRNELVLLL